MEVRVAERRFYFWESYGKAFDMLTDEEAGAFIKACYRFAFEDVEPDFTDVPKLAFAWKIVSGQIARSVEIGVLNAERGKQGGRPRKSGAKTTAKTTAKSGALSGAKSTAESEEKRSEEKGKELSPSKDGERVGASLPAPDGAALAPSNIVTIPPKPSGDW